MRDSRIYLHAIDQSQRIKQQQCIIILVKEGLQSVLRIASAHNVTRSLFKINLYAARGPRNQTGSFYTDCQRNVTTQTQVSLLFIALYSIITADYMYRQLSELEQRSWCAKQSLAKTDSEAKIQRFYLL